MTDDENNYDNVRVGCCSSVLAVGVVVVVLKDFEFVLFVHPPETMTTAILKGFLTVDIDIVCQYWFLPV